MPSRSELDRWNLRALDDWAATLRTGNEKFLLEIDRSRKHFTDVGPDWSGTAYHAAYDRVGQDHDEARKIHGDIEDFLEAFTRAVGDVAAHRDVLRTKAADAEAAQLTVTDDWVVSGHGTDAVHAHQDAVDTARRELARTEGELARLLGERAELVRAAGDLYGSSIEVGEAASQGGRLGAEDGKRLADAVRAGDRDAIDAVAADMPAYFLTPQDLQNLADGKDVATVPAEVQDYYREFLDKSGKDGLLGLSDHLAQQEALARGAGSPNPLAAAQRDNLANAIMMLSNEKVGSTAADGTFRPGGYGQLPDYLRHLVADRLEIAPPPGPLEMHNRFADQARFAQLLGEANPGFVPGAAMASQMQITAASMSSYLDGRNPAATHLVDRFEHLGAVDINAEYFDRDKPRIGDTARAFLDLGTRNHSVDYGMLTDPPGTVRTPGDLYADPKTFREQVFHHDWGDQGKVASQLYSWAGEHAHDQTPDGDLSRKTMVALPHLFAPTDSGGGSALTAGTDGHTVFQNNADLFRKYPELATGLSKVLAPNLDALADPAQMTSLALPVPGDPHRYPVPGSSEVRLGVDDGDRLLFLANQSEDGRTLLETGRALREAAVYDQAMRAGGDHVGDWLSENDAYTHLRDLNARMTAQHYNALFYQDDTNASDTAKHLQEVYESKQKAAEIAKQIITDTIPMDKVTSPITDLLPGVAQGAAKSYLNGLPGLAMDKVIAAWNPLPDPVHVQDPSGNQISSEIRREAMNKLIDADYRSGRLPQNLLTGDHSGPIHYEDNSAKEAIKDITARLKERGLTGYIDGIETRGDIAVVKDLAGDRQKLQNFLNGGSEKIEVK
ncbi:TPR repeat region-containing protein [Nocardia aurantia]|uniref:TPR repeat domain-containing protein n=1 Tax=Nocardia aurantia TaxID=2585199 RepID=A0A7K0DKK1_9NOCA|nr:hypothetical protein [Nocardia aurantia]MQY26198.1 hypothetical protein [Nocardia aurantia]